MNQRLLKNGENINSQDITLFCFPFAGGGASTYTSWIKKLKDKITVCPIQLPGREERIMEKPYTDMSELLRDLTDEIVIAIKGKYVLWGHSMGGKIAYELEKYLENKGYQAQCIFASGCRIPNIPEPNPIYHLKDEAFKRELERFGGTPKKVLENKELLDFFLPMLRADFTLADTYCDNSMTVLHSPSTERSAYIIFTSGTTGEPKGVEISHRSAWNTINEVNKICCVDEHSKILSVSALEFDLSVYDIFGILSEGGTVVVTSENARRDAAVWANAIMDYNITVWNSVPYLLNMLLTVAETEGKVFPSLKKVILSGDWIGLDLPERLKRIAPNAEMLAMGGATEAAIWSNFIQVQLPLPSKWVSIPYGKPLAGQLYRVVDQAGKDCPNWVSGELWIGGDGVAKGYISDDLLTEEKFVYENGIRWYKTGDMGRFWPDGTIEFLGRKDTQVKIRGHRIEMGEIESILNQYPGIISSVVDVVGIKESKKIYAYIISRQKKLDFKSIEQFLKSYLPEYMIPSKFVMGEKIPLSLNGKVERSYVSRILEENLNVESVDYEEPIGTTETTISLIWKKVLKIEKLSRNDDFFEVGGDSLKAVSIMSQLKQKNLVPINTSVQILFTNSTIKKFAEQVNRLNMEENQETEIDTI